MVTTPVDYSKRTPQERAKHAARIKDWRLRNEIRLRVWHLLTAYKTGVKAKRVREALERALNKVEAKL